MNLVAVFIRARNKRQSPCLDSVWTPSLPQVPRLPPLVPHFMPPGLSLQLSCIGKDGVGPACALVRMTERRGGLGGARERWGWTRGS